MRVAAQISSMPVRVKKPARPGKQARVSLGDDLDRAGGQVIPAADDQQAMTGDQPGDQGIGLQFGHVQPHLRPDHVLDQITRQPGRGIAGRAQRVDHRLNMARRWLPGLDRGDRGDDGTASLMAEHEDQPGGLITVRPELDAAEYHLVVHGLRAGPEHEQIPDATVEDNLGRNARIDAGEDQGERLLAGGDFTPAPGGLVRMLQLPVHPALVSLHQQLQSGFLSNFHVSRLCSNSVRTRAARAMGPIWLGLAVTFWSVFHRWESSAKPLSPRHLAELSSIFLVRTLMSSSLTPFGFFTGVRMP